MEEIEKLYDPSSRKGITGLVNLGNTCFMNSALQCLSHCKELVKYFLTDEFLKEINPSIKYGTGGEIAKAFKSLLEQIWLEHNSSIHPSNFRNIFIRFAKQFAGYSQHDSHEMLTFMLDGLHEDLNRNKEKKYFEVKEQKEDESDESASQRFLSNYKQRDDSIISDLFFGQYRSKVECNVCGKISITYDPFMCLTVPIAGNGLSMRLAYIDFEVLENTDVKEISIFYKKTDTVQDAISNSFVDYDNFEFILLVVDAKKMYQKKVKNDEILFNLINNLKSRSETYSFVLYKFTKEYTQDKYPLFISPGIMDIKSQKYELCFYPIILFFDKSSLVADIYKEISQLNTLLFKKDNIDYDLFNVNNLTPCCKDKLPCDKCNSKNCIFCEFNIDKNKTIEELKNSQIKPRSFLLYLNYKIEDTDIFDLKNTFGLLYNDRFDPYDVKINQSIKCDLYSGIEQLSMREQLDKENTWYCPNCKEHRQAYKKLDIMILPKILIIQIKRFKSSGSGLLHNEKNDTLVDFPIKNLIIKGQKYNLFAVSQHYGTCFFGHYKAICLCNGEFYEYDDETVYKIDEGRIVDSNAYILFYERVE